MYVVLVIALFQSHFYWVFDVFLIGVMSAYFIFLWRMQTPGSPCVQIQYLEQQWRIYNKREQFECYQLVRIRFDFGWLMWLVFQNQLETRQSSRTHVLVFQDQLYADESRLLRALLRVSV
ncbi:MAG: hypothetical protein K0U37_08975 [Gammaproteobacteria bacterium]|nr:hypothetical protein [Gammaproteobacteria bacterium]